MNSRSSCLQQFKEVGGITNVTSLISTVSIRQSIYKVGPAIMFSGGTERVLTQ